uniref:Uncharacterized protein n=1 Tax=Anopheles melas TaxID=34690 RepID=A0A182TPI8_9DIPT
MAASPGSDNNCNIYMPPLGCSVASSHDFSDYQWFTDFGSYRDGVATHQSILSALSASYNGIGELSYYEKMAKDIDANLAEIDMESFRKEDINSLLTAIPTQLRLDDAERRTRNNNRIFSTITSCTAAGLIPADMMDNSFCKSEILFSPVKESHISVDSLDMDGYPDEEDIILTCQANKDNYTIAFEQSILYSEESYYGKCSTTGGGSIGGRQGEEDEFQLDSLDAQINNAHVNANNNNGSDGGEDDPNEERGPPSSPQRAHGTNGGSVPGHMKLNDFNRQMHGSPRRQYKGFSMNIGGRRLLQDLLQQHNGSCAGSASPLNSSTSINNNNNNNSHNVNNNNSYKDTNSDTSRTSENLTQIFNHSGNNNTTTSTGSKTKIPIDMITKSMQTSLIGAPAANGGTVTREKVRVIPPSFLDRLNELGDKQKAPVFVVYPNYALPDLGFLKAQNEVVISPLSFKETMTGAGRPLKKPRPVSMNDIENIRQREYKHVTDWKSLVFLLPTEYRKLLRHIPEVGELSMSTEKQPMFCMTPPLRRGVARGVSCDCTNLLQQNTQTYNSSSSGGSSSAAPSSGYRGSSTMLTTDSEMDGILAPSNSSNLFNNNLYVYQYDSPAEVLVPCERPPSGRTAGVAPKSILRRPQGSVRGASNSSGSGANGQSNMKAKRSSMFEEQQGPNFPQGSREKRRSLQEHHSYNFYEDAEEEEEDYEEHRIEQKLHNSPNMIPHPRLANTPKLPSADHYHKLNKLVEMNDNDMANLAHGKHQQCVDEDLEARARAEQFLSHVPKSELKHYAEIAHILESTEMIESSEPPYDRTRLRNEVSRLLSQKRSVAFTKQQTTPPLIGGNNTTPVRQQAAPATALLRPTEIKFSTPPNSPNMSVTVAKTGGMMGEKKPPVAQRTPSSLAGSPASGTEKEKQDKIQTNRFKRLQIQWELLSKESTKASSESQRKEIRSGGNTPTGGNGGPKSRIPRPFSGPLDS